MAPLRYRFVGHAMSGLPVSHWFLVGYWGRGKWARRERDCTPHHNPRKRRKRVNSRSRLFLLDWHSAVMLQLRLMNLVPHH